MNYSSRDRFDKVDAIINKRFSASYMSNSKWNKMMKLLIERLGEFFVYYKLVYDKKIESYIFDMPDTPFFLEPILYKEVEWIEFPDIYEDWVNRNNLKAGKRIYSQDINEFEYELNSIGGLKFEKLDHSIRIYAYQ